MSLNNHFCWVATMTDLLEGREADEPIPIDSTFRAIQKRCM
ncbi:MAG: hypothetical protein ACJZ81_01875 [Paracoccaceae bacterium]